MDAIVKLLALLLCYNLLVSFHGSNANNAADNEDGFQYIFEKDNDSFALDKVLAERSGEDVTFIRHRDSYIIVEAKGEAEKFFSQFNPHSGARSHGAHPPVKYIQIPLEHRGPVFDENKNLVLTGDFLQRVLRKIKIKVKIKFRKGQKIPHMLIFPKGGKLNLPQPIFLTWKPYANDCLLPLCDPKSRNPQNPPGKWVQVPHNKYKVGQLKKPALIKPVSGVYRVVNKPTESETGDEEDEPVKIVHEQPVAMKPSKLQVHMQPADDEDDHGESAFESDDRGDFIDAEEPRSETYGRKTQSADDGEDSGSEGDRVGSQSVGGRRDSKPSLRDEFDLKKK